MALPSGVTRIPSRSVSYTVQDSFPLVGRNGNTAAGDIANPGNVWATDSRRAQRHSVRLDAVIDGGNLQMAAIGKDVRSWVQATATIALTATRLSLQPNSIYFVGSSSSVDISGVDSTAFKVGDRISIFNVGTGQVDFIFASGTAIYSGGTFTTKLRLKSGGGAKLGTGFTLEYGYLAVATPSLGWYVVASNGVVGTLGDGNPIGTS